jgi:Secretion system C-terminal sorting domain
MKAKITFLLIMIFSITSNGQNPINAFFGINGVVYDVVTSTPDIDQTPIGANAVWNFNQLVLAGQSVSNNSIPTAAQIATFPNSTALNTVLTTVNNIDSTSQIFSKNIANEISITGFQTPELTLNYTTNNAKIGTFPLNYGYNFTDTTAGTFTNGTNTGTFTGNVITTVDAYGTLNLNNTGNGSFSGLVTRLKTVQNINLNILIFPVGTVVQTTYAYFSSINTSPELRYTKAVINIPQAGLNNQTVIQIEDYFGLLLSTKNNDLINKIQIFPNPVNDILNIKTDNNQKINALILSDINGREIINQTLNTENINVSELQKGIYFLKIDSDNGIFTKKIIKN